MDGWVVGGVDGIYLLGYRLFGLVLFVKLYFTFFPIFCTSSFIFSGGSGLKQAGHEPSLSISVWVVSLLQVGQWGNIFGVGMV